MFRKLYSIFVTAFLASSLSAAPLSLWSGSTPEPSGGEKLSCDGRSDCLWKWSGTPLRLDSIGAFEAELIARSGSPLDVAGLELVVLWENGAVGFDLLLPSSARERQTIPLAPIWAEGEEIDWSIPPEAIELHWKSDKPVETELILLNWRWLHIQPHPDEIGKMGPYREMIEAIQVLKEGAKPPYSGVRGERVEKARRIHQQLWKVQRKKGNPLDDMAKWKEGRRWMAQAWALNGPTSLPTPKERRGFWVQALDRALPGIADSLSRAGSTLLIEEGDLLDSAFALSPLRKEAKRLGIEWIPALSWGHLSEKVSRERLLQFDSLGWLQRDPNGEPLPALSNCVEDAVSFQLEQIEQLLEKSGASAVAIQELELLFGASADYHPTCRARFEASMATQYEEREEIADLLSRWPGSVFPDSSLYDDFREFQGKLLDSVVIQIASRLHKNETEFWAVVDDDARRSAKSKGARWGLWSATGEIDLLLPKLFENDLGRLRIRLERLRLELAAMTAQRQGKAIRVLPMITLWETANWRERQELARQLEQIAELRRQKIGEGFILYTANAAWLRHDAAWVARGALQPPSTTPAR